MSCTFIFPTEAVDLFNRMISCFVTFDMTNHKHAANNTTFCIPEDEALFLIIS